MAHALDQTQPVGVKLLVRLHLHSAEADHVNFMTEENEDPVRATWGDNYNRLAAVKARWDPGNLFHMNQNIEPAR